MKKIILTVIYLSFYAMYAKSADPKLTEFANSIKWSSQASVSFTLDNKQIYVDPYHLKNAGKADLIFITHSHGDHFSMEDINKIATSSTKIYAPKSCLSDLKSNGFNPIEVSSGDKISIGGISIIAVPAYTITKGTHPKASNFVGFVFDADGIEIYHPGDTELIPEMKNIDCDITFMPLGQKYTMNSVDDAVQSVLDVKAEVAIPFHFGLAEGKDEDAAEFKKKLEGKVDVIILDRE